MFVFITDQNPLSRAHLFDVDFELVQKSSQILQEQATFKLLRALYFLITQYEEKTIRILVFEIVYYTYQLK